MEKQLNHGPLRVTERRVLEAVEILDRESRFTNDFTLRIVAIKNELMKLASDLATHNQNFGH